jgi:hypothetical protein
MAFLESVMMADPKPHMFTLFFLLVGFRSITPLVKLSNPTSYDPKELGFCDVYTSDEK